MIAVPGVQRFIDEARSTADVHAASEIVARLAAEGARACAAASPAVRLIFPAWENGRDHAARDGASGPDGPAGPNRIVLMAPPEIAEDVARTAVEAIEAEWRRLLRATFRMDGDDAVPPRTPGMPVTVWVRVPAGEGGYAEQWARAQAAMAARRVLRDFPPVQERDTELCDLSPRWAAAGRPPPGLRPHEEARLAPANWVKRRWRHVRAAGGSDAGEVVGFPSTSSIASAPFRREVLQRLDDEEIARWVRALREAAQAVNRAAETPVPALEPFARNGGGLARWLAASGGPWVYPERWQAERLARDTKRPLQDIRQAAERGRRAAQTLLDVMGDGHRIRPPTDYLAVIVQDLDDMGLFLSGRRPAADGTRLAPDPERHRDVSRRLAGLSVEQAARFGTADLLGVPVYAGGDDLLGFAPASTALAAARAVRDSVPAESRTASTAVVFFHQSHSLRDALHTARELLDDAKENVHGKNALAVAYLRRSGATEASAQPWQDRSGTNAVQRFAVFAADADHLLSPRLLADLQRDQGELAGLHRVAPERYRDELARLVGRHMANPDETAAWATARELEALGMSEALRPREVPADVPYPLPAARVAVFLRQEAWPYPQRQEASR
ncbi:Cas10/Cmr2 second palm domain-containing protein [Thermomonospora cellulosilytica]|uniref:CRISPR-associated protein Cmr2 n=1 Tax=Thermomonospora cellulosilytica TaxID=1411118 RepID=A0A7W3N4A3_9ACTN|nr:type III-B CRISPR-associated protein Cas10/Cmr2 [Thermomonospora cellulosilytica]MBA9007294.1 CRISPR-associated protein Cmr2 [Thermomonospora cellulosilytica]